MSVLSKVIEKLTEYSESASDALLRFHTWVSKKLNVESKDGADAELDIPKSTNVIYWACIALLSVFILWASIFEIQEFVHATAKVEPSSEVKTINILEGAIIEKVFVSEGDIVQQDQPLLKFQADSLETNYKQNLKNYYTLLGNVDRLHAQINNTPFNVRHEIAVYSPELAAELVKSFNNRMESNKNTLGVLEEQISQYKAKVTELENRMKNIDDSMQVSKRELEIIKPLEEKKLVSTLRRLQTEKEYADKMTQYNAAKDQLVAAKEQVDEFEKRLAQTKNELLQKDLKESQDTNIQLSNAASQVSIWKDRYKNAVVTAPVSGIVKEISNKTVGSAIANGNQAISIVPIDDKMVVTAYVQPNDIGFVHKGDKASVKLTAYDYSIYGYLEGSVDDVSPDAFVNPEQKNMSFFKVKVLVPSNHIEHNNHKYYITPGMQATVDIYTGNRTVMHYILKPIIKTANESLGER